MKKELHDLIIKGQIDKVIYKLRDMLANKNSKLLLQVISLGSNWEDLKSNIILGRLSQEDISIEKNKLISNLLLFIESIANEDSISNKANFTDEEPTSKDQIGAGLSITLAIGYYHNFVKRINEILLEEEVLRLEIYEKLQSPEFIIHSKNVTFELWIPSPKSSDYKSVKELSKSENLEMIKIKTRTRPFVTYGKVEGEKVTLIDIPTTLYSIKSSFEIFAPIFQFSSTIEEEFKLFEKSLRYLIEINSNKENNIEIKRM